MIYYRKVTITSYSRISQTSNSRRSRKSEFRFARLVVNNWKHNYYSIEKQASSIDTRWKREAEKNHYPYKIVRNLRRICRQKKAGSLMQDLQDKLWL